MTGKKKGRGSDIGPVLGDDAKEAAAFARDVAMRAAGPIGMRVAAGRFWQS